MPFVAADNPKPDAEIGAGDLLFALCLCPAASWYRSDRNADKPTGSYGWQVWAAQHHVDPSRIYRIEDVWSAEELRAAGLERRSVPSVANREAALLAASKTQRNRL